MLLIYIELSNFEEHYLNHKIILNRYNIKRILMYNILCIENLMVFTVLRVYSVIVKFGDFLAYWYANHFSGIYFGGHRVTKIVHVVLLTYF